MTMPKFTSQILLLFSTILHILGKLFLKDFTRLKVVSCLGSHGENTAFLFLGQTTMKKPLRRKPSGWRRKASIERSHTRQRFPEPDGWEPCCLHVARAFHPVEPLLLDDAIDPLGDRIIGGLVVLRHADRGLNGLQTFNILITTVLDASVGVMDQPFKPQMGHT